MGLWKYVKEAFKWHWNLLALGAGAAFGILSGQPDVILPLVVAGELAYLGLLATHPKFQKAIESREAAVEREKKALTTDQALRRITSALPPHALKRYAELRARCLQLRDIARDLRQPGVDQDEGRLESMQLKSLDRLLWIYLRLAYTEHRLQQFLEATDEDAMRNDIERIKRRLAGYAENETSPRRAKARRAIEDTLKTSQLRLANLAKARENHELVQLEIERLEHKIRSVAEMAVNRQEPEFISDQVDAVTKSLLETERTMDELEFATGLGEVEEAVPELTARRTTFETS